MFKIVKNKNGGFSLKIKHRSEVVTKPDFFCEKCQRTFKSSRGLHLHNIKIHTSK